MKYFKITGLRGVHIFILAQNEDDASKKFDEVKSKHPEYRKGKLEETVFWWGWRQFVGFPSSARAAWKEDHNSYWSIA